MDAEKIVDRERGASDECSTCNKSPGKFEGPNGIIEYYFWYATLNGGGGDYTTTKEGITDWFEVTKEDVENLSSLHSKNTVWTWCEKHCLEASEILSKIFGIGVWEDSTGFVRVLFYESEKEYRKALAEEE